MADIIDLDPQAGADGEVNTPAYGYYRERGLRAPMLGFEQRDGRWFALSYSGLGYAEFTPATCNADGVETLLFRFGAKQEVVIRGRNLEPIWQHGLHHRLLRIAETGENGERGREDATVVNSIAVNALS